MKKFWLSKAKNKDNDIVEKKSALEVPHVDEETLKEYIFGVNTKLDENQRLLFIKTAKLYNLNPIKREIYATAYYDKKTGKYNMAIIVGYEVYLKRAERSGKLSGWKSWTTGSIKTGDLTGHIAIQRKDWKMVFEYEVDYNEFVQKKFDGTITKFWKEKPKFMIKKVTEATGFRKCFSDELGGMPYTADELPEEMTTPINITPDKPKIEKKKPEPTGPIEEKGALPITEREFNGIKEQGAKEALGNAKPSIREMKFKQLHKIHEALNKRDPKYDAGFIKNWIGNLYGATTEDELSDDNLTDFIKESSTEFNNINKKGVK
jgi:phage recombination protein Bet